MRTTRVVILAAGLGLAGWTGSGAFAQSELVFSDPFNVSGSAYDLGFEAANRQTGSAGVLSYLERPEHMAGGPADEYTQLDGTRLYLQVTDTTWVSPDYNFKDGPEFSLEVEINATDTNPDRTSDDWAAVVFGATQSGAFVNASDGMGILFRNNGGYQVFDGGQAIYSSAAEDALPGGDVRLKIDVVGTGFSGSAPATVAFTVNGAPLKVTAEGGNTYTRAAGFRANRITLLGYAATGNSWFYTFDNLRVNAKACAHFVSSPAVLRVGDPAPTVAVKVPQAFAPAGGSAVLRVRSRSPEVAVPVGASNGELALTFSGSQPADLQKSFEVEVKGGGQASFELLTERPVCLGEPYTVTVLSGFVRNPSFEDNTITAFPGYGPVLEWEGASGVNVLGVNSGGPFHDNGVYPDRNQIGFKQGNGAVRQEIKGLTPGQSYWLQLRYNIRNCCGTFVQNMVVRFDGVDLETINGIQAVGGDNPYRSRSFTFTPAGESGFLEIESTGEGDHTLLLDAVTIVQRGAGQVTVYNPSFEASGLAPGNGVVSPARLSEWTGEGTYGVNLGGGPFADNGKVPDQDNVAFIQGAGSLSQNLIGLIPGRTYTVSFAANARSGNAPNLRVTAGEAVVFEGEIAPVGGAAAYSAKTGTFVAAGSSAVLRFAQTKEGDHTVLLDDIRVAGEAITIPPIEVAPRAAELAVGVTGVRFGVTVPAVLIATEPATVTVTSLNPAIAVPLGAANGVLTMTFPAGGETTQFFEVQALARGAATFRVANPQNVPVNNDQLTISVSGSFVRNPSFESNFHPTFPGYGPIDAWDSEGPGNTGVNNSTGPFHDNGAIPDRGQVALLQTTKTIRQQVVGLTPGKVYWLQFYYNTRNCCGGTISLIARFDGNDLFAADAITPVGSTNSYYPAHVEFTPTTASGLLEFVATAEGDATALLDGISIVQRDAGNLIVRNPGFEASGRAPFPGYVQPAELAGWTGFGGGRGVNATGVGPFADNGVNPDQDSVAFLQNAGTGLRQTVEGLTPGTSYIVSVAANARGGNSPRLKISADGNVLFEESIAPVGGTAPYRRVEASFVAAADTAEIAFEQTAEGDHTVLLDDVVVKPGTVATRPRLQVARTPAGIRIAWPSSAAGAVLQTSAAVTGVWADSNLPVIVEGGQSVVLDTTADAARYYRLIQR